MRRGCLKGSRGLRKLVYTSSLQGPKSDRAHWSRRDIKRSDIHQQPSMSSKAKKANVTELPPLELIHPAKTVPNLAARLRSGEKYPALRKQLMTLLPELPSAALFVANSLALSAPGPDGAAPYAQNAHTSPAAHLLLESLDRACSQHAPRLVFAVTLPRSRIEVCEARAVAAQLFMQAVVGDVLLDVRLVVRLAQTFGLDDTDLHAACGARWRDAVLRFCSSLLESGNVAPPVALVLHFQLQELASIDTLSTLVGAGQEGLAEEMAACLEPSVQRQLVRVLQQQEAFKFAHRAVKKFKMEAEFPEVRRMHYESSLAKLAGRQQWEVAAAMAGGDPVLQAHLVRLMVEAGEVARAAEHHTAFNLPGAPPGGEAAARLMREAAEQYLALSLPRECVHMVGTLQHLECAVQHLVQQDAIGLDAEWRPSFGKSDPDRPVSILQLASREQVYLLDMLALGGTPPREFDHILAPLMRSPTPLKLGYAVKGDFHKVANSYKSLECFHTVHGVLDLAALAAHDQTDTIGETARHGLTGLAERYLGKPLDKRQRMTDWERRPLSNSQVTYAALDAFSLLGIYDALRARLAARAQSAALAPSAWTYQRKAPRAASASFATMSPAHARPLDSESEQSIPLKEDEVSSTATTAAADSLVRPVVRQSQSDEEQVAASSASCRVHLALDTSHVEAEVARTIARESARVLRLAGGSVSAAEAARAVGVSVEDVVKSIGVMVHGEPREPTAIAAQVRFGDAAEWPVLVLLRGHQRADLSLLARELGVGRHRVRMASRHECVAVFGYPPGSMPPMGLRQLDTLTIADALVAEHGGCASETQVYCGAGAPDAMLAVDPHHLLASIPVCKVMDVALRPLEDYPASSVPDDLASLHSQCREGLSRQQPRFVIDPALGRLGRWLRCLGVDVAAVKAESVPRRDPSSLQRLLMELSRREERIILTRDRALFARRSCPNAFFIDHLHPKDQIKQVVDHFQLSLDKASMLTRCSHCNGVVEEKLCAADLKDNANVPTHVLATVDEFWACGTCGKVFWIGPMSNKAVEFMESLSSLLESSPKNDILESVVGEEDDVEADNVLEQVQ